MWNSIFEDVKFQYPSGSMTMLWGHNLDSNDSF